MPQITDQVRQDVRDVVYEFLADECDRDVEGFCALMALADPIEPPSRMCCPFDKARTGFVMGEGGGMLVVESIESAVRRGIRVYAEMSAPGLTGESYNIMSPQPGGSGMVRAMEQALRNAELTPDDIGYVNAHGTSTQLNDRSLSECRCGR